MPDFSVKLIKEESSSPNLSKFKIPAHLLDPSYKMYNITLECNDMNELRKRLYFLPVKYFMRDPSS